MHNSMTLLLSLQFNIRKHNRSSYYLPYNYFHISTLFLLHKYNKLVVNNLQQLCTTSRGTFVLVSKYCKYFYTNSCIISWKNLIWKDCIKHVT